MSAYVVFIRESVRDPALMKEYSTLAWVARGDTMRFLAAYGEVVALEGKEADGVVIAEFPTMEEAKAWYSSAAYQKAKDIRKRAADFRVLLIAGV